MSSEKKYKIGKCGSQTQMLQFRTVWDKGFVWVHLRTNVWVHYLPSLEAKSDLKLLREQLGNRSMHVVLKEASGTLHIRKCLA